MVITSSQDHILMIIVLRDRQGIMTFFKQQIQLMIRKVKWFAQRIYGLVFYNRAKRYFPNYIFKIADR